MFRFHVSAVLLFTTIFRVGGRLFGSHVDTESSCDCRCCTVEPRRPGELHTEGVTAKCGAMPLGDTRSSNMHCQRTCALVDTEILNSGTRSGVLTVELERYCFYHCAPTTTESGLEKIWAQAGTGGSLLDSDCEDLSVDDKLRAVASDGNGADHESQSG
mmetsp:Transcript_48477/g.128411  ORF Transcript_48477/g.128411 Transcript_48477/m.128411 type:complete len:159 (-) Transcript_48477:432-908(-)